MSINKSGEILGWALLGQEHFLEEVPLISTGCDVPGGGPGRQQHNCWKVIRGGGDLGGDLIVLDALLVQSRAFSDNHITYYNHKIAISISRSHRVKNQYQLMLLTIRQTIFLVGSVREEVPDIFLVVTIEII